MAVHLGRRQLRVPQEPQKRSLELAAREREVVEEAPEELAERRDTLSSLGPRERFGHPGASDEAKHECLLDGPLQAAGRLGRGQVHEGARSTLVHGIACRRKTSAARSERVAWTR